MAPSRWFLLSACVSLSLACGDEGIGDDPIIPSPDGGEEEPPPDASRPGKTCEGASMQLGTGSRSFQPVSDDSTVYLYRGPQGGYMIFLSVRVVGLDRDDVELCYVEKFSSTGRVFGEGCWRIRLTNDLGGGMYERVGVWGQVHDSYWTRPGAIRGSDARVDVTVTDTTGCQVSAGWNVHISNDPGM